MLTSYAADQLGAGLQTIGKDFHNIGDGLKDLADAHRYDHDSITARKEIGTYAGGSTSVGAIARAVAKELQRTQGRQW